MAPNTSRYSMMDFDFIFHSVFTENEECALMATCLDETLIYPFLFYSRSECFYIVDLDDCLVISWYKQVGRGNYCSSNLSNYSDLKRKFEEIKKALFSE